MAAFGQKGGRPEPLGEGWEGGWRSGEIVLSLVADHARAAWSAKVRETLFVDGLRLARPVRSTDGRYVVSGWRADTFVSGDRTGRRFRIRYYRGADDDRLWGKILFGAGAQGPP